MFLKVLAYRTHRIRLLDLIGRVCRETSSETFTEAVVLTCSVKEGSKFTTKAPLKEFLF